MDVHETSGVVVGASSLPSEIIDINHPSNQSEEQRVEAIRSRMDSSHDECKHGSGGVLPFCGSVNNGMGFGASIEPIGEENVVAPGTRAGWRNVARLEEDGGSMTAPLQSRPTAQDGEKEEIATGRVGDSGCNGLASTDTQTPEATATDFESSLTDIKLRRLKAVRLKQRSWEAHEFLMDFVVRRGRLPRHDCVEEWQELLFWKECKTVKDDTTMDGLVLAMTADNPGYGEAWCRRILEEFFDGGCPASIDVYEGDCYWYHDGLLPSTRGVVIMDSVVNGKRDTLKRYEDLLRFASGQELADLISRKCLYDLQQLPQWDALRKRFLGDGWNIRPTRQLVKINSYKCTTFSFSIRDYQGFSVDNPLGGQLDDSYRVNPSDWKCLADYQYPITNRHGTAMDGFENPQSPYIHYNKAPNEPSEVQVGEMEDNVFVEMGARLPSNRSLPKDTELVTWSERVKIGGGKLGDAAPERYNIKFLVGLVYRGTTRGEDTAVVGGANIEIMLDLKFCFGRMSRASGSLLYRYKPRSPIELNSTDNMFDSNIFKPMACVDHEWVSRVVHKNSFVVLSKTCADKAAEANAEEIRLMTSNKAKTRDVAAWTPQKVLDLAGHTYNVDSFHLGVINHKQLYSIPRKGEHKPHEPLATMSGLPFPHGFGLLDQSTGHTSFVLTNQDILLEACLRFDQCVSSESMLRQAVCNSFQHDSMEVGGEDDGEETRFHARVSVMLIYKDTEATQINNRGLFTPTSTPEVRMDNGVFYFRLQLTKTAARVINNAMAMFLVEVVCSSTMQVIWATKTAEFRVFSDHFCDSNKNILPYNIGFYKDHRCNVPTPVVRFEITNVKPGDGKGVVIGYEEHLAVVASLKRQMSQMDDEYKKKLKAVREYIVAKSHSADARAVVAIIDQPVDSGSVHVAPDATAIRSTTLSFFPASLSIHGVKTESKLPWIRAGADLKAAIHFQPGVATDMIATHLRKTTNGLFGHEELYFLVHVVDGSTKTTSGPIPPPAPANPDRTGFLRLVTPTRYTPACETGTNVLVCTANELYNVKITPRAFLVDGQSIKLIVTLYSPETNSGIAHALQSTGIEPMLSEAFDITSKRPRTSAQAAKSTQPTHLSLNWVSNSCI